MKLGNRQRSPDCPFIAVHWSRVEIVFFQVSFSQFWRARVNVLVMIEKGELETREIVGIVLQEFPVGLVIKTRTSEMLRKLNADY